MYKIFMFVIVMCMLMLGLNVYAHAEPTEHIGNVKDNNNGNAGYILVNTGNQQGNHNDIGTWTDANFLKGENGVDGVDGVDGVNGKDGVDGNKGDIGLAGKDGTNGVDGERGLRGRRGKIGKTGDKGDLGLTGKDGDVGVGGNDGAIGADGDKGDIGEQGIQGLRGLIGEQGIKGEKGALDKRQVEKIDNKINNNTRRLDNHENRIDTLEETDVNIVGEIDFIRKENFTMGVYGKYDIRHNEVPEVGLKITIGLGKSESQVKRERLERRIENLERKLNVIGVKPTVEKTANGWKMSISEKDTPKVLKRF